MNAPIRILLSVLLFAACTKAAPPPQGVMEVGIFRDVTNITVSIWTSGKIKFDTPPPGLDLKSFHIHRDEIPKLRSLIKKAEDWSSVAKKNQVTAFTKTLGTLGSLETVGVVRFEFATYDALYGAQPVILISGKEIPWTIEEFSALKVVLDKIPELERELHDLDQKFK